MRQPYEQNLDQNFKPEFTYADCLRIVKNLEAVKRCHLTHSPIIEKAARLMQRQMIYNLPALNHVIEDVAAKALEQPTPIISPATA